MYTAEPLFPYAQGKYSVMPSGLPERFYPEDANRVYKTENYVICFDEGVSQEIKQRLIDDYAEYYLQRGRKEFI